MEQIVAKIVNLSYELLGVFLPGFCILSVFSVFVVVHGDLLTSLTFGGIPTLTLDWTERFVKRLDVKLGIGVGIPMFLLSYFLGNTLVWISRSGKSEKQSGALHLLRNSLFFKILKPVDSYNPTLEPLFKKVRAKFVAPEDSPLEWRMFYPVGKAYLARNLKNSLVSTYQNKYTFHRSLVLSTVVTFWLCAISLMIAAVIRNYKPVAPHWWLLGIWALFSLFMANGFTASYRLNWGLFGDTIITELYSLLCGPEAKSDGHK